MSYTLLYEPDISKADYAPRGNIEKFIYCKEAEVIASGPSETGKTLGACWKIHYLATKYKGLNGAIVRKTHKSMPGSVLQTFDRVIKDSPVQKYGGENPSKYIYPNGSQIWIEGMDTSGDVKGGNKLLGTERDFIYVNQAEELALDDWEKLLTRTTGRGAVMPYTQLFGDCNPAGSKHWIKERARNGKLILINTNHKDNPSLYTDDAQLTEQGIKTMDRLERMTGVRRKRLKDGIWATAEGAVYDTFDSAIHVKVRLYDEMKRFYLTMDEGYTNPAVILLVGVDNDDRWHVFREYYERGKLQAVVVREAVNWMKVYDKDLGNDKKEEVKVSLVAVDESAAGLIADLQNSGVPANGAKGRVLDGIQHIQDKLEVQKDNMPRLTVDPSCINVVNEFESYTWKVTPNGISKDEPTKENDHSMDALRYLDDAMMPMQIF